MAIDVSRFAPKERLRGLGLAVFVNFSAGVPMEDAMRKADEAGLVIASNQKLGNVLESEAWRSISRAFACWTGTVAAYDEPGKKLGKTIEYIEPRTGVRWVFTVPENHVGEKNLVFVANHPNFTFETDGNTRIVHATGAGVISGFPVSSDRWYLGDSEYGIPTGTEVNGGAKDARFFRRIDKRVGLVVVGNLDYTDHGNMRVVCLCHEPFNRFGVVVEARAGGHAANLQI